MTEGVTMTLSSNQQKLVQSCSYLLKIDEFRSTSGVTCRSNRSASMSSSISCT